LDDAVLVRTTYLEQHSADQVRPARRPDEPVEIVRVTRPAPEFSRFLYVAVGGDWYWYGRLPWTREQWVTYLNQPLTETWVAYVDGAPAGYIELTGVSTVDSLDVEIAYFGLLPGFLGLGIGGHLLTEGLYKAWTMVDRWQDSPPVSRVWVHTCSLDGPTALANYEARGLVVYKSQEAEEDVPEHPVGSWPTIA
jgi:ribosomal protein S18 acetylase RimI-like enzyme